MLFKAVELKNFMSYQRATFEVEDGLTLVDGPNGGGKSSLWDGISWALFGKTVRGASGDQIVNRQAEEDCQVQVNLEVRGKKYRVVRNRAHSKYQNRLWVEVDGKTIEQGTVDHTQDWLVTELGIDFDLFCCTVLFGQEGQFNFVNASNTDQKKVLGKIMRVNFAAFQLRAKEKAKELVTRVQKIDRDLAVLKSHVGDPEEKYAGDVKAWNKTQFERIADITEQLLQDKKNITQLKQKTDGRDVKEIEAKLEKIVEKMKEFESRGSELTQKKNKASGNIIALEREVKRLGDLVDAGKCPTCEQEVKEFDLVDQIHAQKRTITSYKDKIERIDEALAKNIEAQNILLSKREHARDVIVDVKHATKQITQHEESFLYRKQQLETCRNETNPFVERITKEKAKQAEIKTKIDGLTEEIETIREEEPYIDFWVKAFGDDGIKSFIFDLICSTLTERANEYLNTLTSGTISVAFDTQKKLKSGEIREKFDCQVITGGEAVDYKNYSGGEKRRISLAVDMALSSIMADQYGSPMNVVVFDEQTSYMDDNGRKGFMELLKDLSKTKSVYVVDHDSEFKAAFDNVVSIRKNADGVSELC